MNEDISQQTKLYVLFNSPGRATQNHPEYTGPSLGPKMAKKNERNFSDEQIRQGRDGVIGLQSGSNKGASQVSNEGVINIEITVHPSDPSPASIIWKISLSMNDDCEWKRIFCWSSWAEVNDCGPTLGALQLQFCFGLTGDFIKRFLPPRPSDWEWCKAPSLINYVLIAGWSWRNGEYKTHVTSIPTYMYLLLGGWVLRTVWVTSNTILYSNDL